MNNMITNKQAIEALNTIKEYCQQTDLKKCQTMKCFLEKWCDERNQGSRKNLPEYWQIPQLGGKRRE